MATTADGAADTFEAGEVAALRNTLQTLARGQGPVLQGVGDSLLNRLIQAVGEPTTPEAFHKLIKTCELPELKLTLSHLLLAYGRANEPGDTDLLGELITGILTAVSESERKSLDEGVMEVLDSPISKMAMVKLLLEGHTELLTPVRKHRVSLSGLELLWELPSDASSKSLIDAVPPEKREFVSGNRQRRAVAQELMDQLCLRGLAEKVTTGEEDEYATTPKGEKLLELLGG
jgi:hypothetical protein